MRCSKLPFEEVGGELVILDVENDVFFSSNAVGMAIWKSIEEPKSVDDLCAIIKDAFNDVRCEDIEKDVNEFIQELLERDLATTLKA